MEGLRLLYGYIYDAVNLPSGTFLCAFNMFHHVHVVPQNYSTRSG